MTDLFLTATSITGSIIPNPIPTEKERISTALKTFGVLPKEGWLNSTAYPEKPSASFERMRVPLQS